MYEIDVCYKIIFEAMVGDAVLPSVAEQIMEYAKVKIAFFSESGELLAAAGFDGDFVPFIEKKHLTVEDYRLFHQKTMRGEEWETGFYLIRQGSKVLGYILLIYKYIKEDSFFEELGQALSQSLSHYFAEREPGCVYNQSLREHIIAWSIFVDGNLSKLPEYLKGKYITARFPKRKGEERHLTGVLRGLSKHYASYLYENRECLQVVFCEITDEKAENLYTTLNEKQILVCISEPFQDLELCRAKQKFLSKLCGFRIDSAKQMVRREKDWSVQGLYTYASSVIEEAVLSDYAISRLIRKDEENNTELYYTLKIYLLCENNITLTAKQLHIHRNTLVYRLKQIQECLCMEIDETSSRQILAFMMMYDITRQYKENRKRNEDSAGITGNI